MGDVSLKGRLANRPGSPRGASSPPDCSLVLAAPPDASGGALQPAGGCKITGTYRPRRYYSIGGGGDNVGREEKTGWEEEEKRGEKREKR